MYLSLYIYIYIYIYMYIYIYIYTCTIHHPPPGGNLGDCKGARVETKASIHHLLWVVFIYIYI